MTIAKLCSISVASQHGKWPQKGQSIECFPFSSEIPGNHFSWTFWSRPGLWCTNAAEFRRMFNISFPCSSSNASEVDHQDPSAGKGKPATRTRNQGERTLWLQLKGVSVQGSIPHQMFGLWVLSPSLCLNILLCSRNTVFWKQQT